MLARLYPYINDKIVNMLKTGNLPIKSILDYYCSKSQYIAYINTYYQEIYKIITNNSNDEFIIENDEFDDDEGADLWIDNILNSFDVIIDQFKQLHTITPVFIFKTDELFCEIIRGIHAFGKDLLNEVLDKVKSFCKIVKTLRIDNYILYNEIDEDDILIYPTLYDFMKSNMKYASLLNEDEYNEDEDDEDEDDEDEDEDEDDDDYSMQPFSMIISFVRDEILRSSYFLNKPHELDMFYSQLLNNGDVNIWKLVQIMLSSHVVNDFIMMELLHDSESFSWNRTITLTSLNPRYSHYYSKIRKLYEGMVDEMWTFVIDLLKLDEECYKIYVAFNDQTSKSPEYMKLVEKYNQIMLNNAKNMYEFNNILWSSKTYLYESFEDVIRIISARQDPMMLALWLDRFLRSKTDDSWEMIENIPKQCYRDEYEMIEFKTIALALRNEFTGIMSAYHPVTLEDINKCLVKINTEVLRRYNNNAAYMHNVRLLIKAYYKSDLQTIKSALESIILNI